MMKALLVGGRRRTAVSWHRSRFSAEVQAGPRRGAATAPPLERPTESSLFAATRKLSEAFRGQAAVAEVAADADAAVPRPAVLARLERELAAGEETLEVKVLGQTLNNDGRRVISVHTPTGPAGGAPVRTIKMCLPSADDVAKLIVERRETGACVEKSEDLANILEKFLKDHFLAKSSDHVALISAWGPKPLGDAEGEFGEVAALMALYLRAFRGTLASMKEDFQFEVNRSGDGKECLVMPPSNVQLLGLQDAFHMLLRGYRVILVVQPRFFPHYQELQRGFSEAGLPDGMLEVLPGITPEADPEVLHEVLKSVDRLQFTGSSAMFKSLVKKAYELGNLRLNYAGEVSGLNKIRLDGVSVSHPAAAAGSAWASMANNGELCTSASLLEFDPATGDTAAAVKAALEAHPFKLGGDPTDDALHVLLKDGKTDKLEVLTELPAGGFKEWWEKTVLAVPVGSPPGLMTNQSLGHCIYAPSITRAVEAGVKEDASCIYCVGVPDDASAPSARASTTGAKLPESVFGGMKSYTFAVAGDHDGVGSVQACLDTVKRRGPNWRDQEEAYAEYELTDTAEDLFEFLGPREQVEFKKTINNVLEVFKAFEPEVSQPYAGQPLVGAEGSSQLLTMTALRPSRKNLLIPRGVGLPDEIIKVALLAEMSPLRELPIKLHLLSARQAGKLRVTDPLKSFLRVVEKRLKWEVVWHDDYDRLVSVVQGAEYPSYFSCVKDKHVLPLDLLIAVADQGGYIYEGLPTDALSLFRWMTTTQAWTVACTEGQVAEAKSALESAWRTAGLREESHDGPHVIKPVSRSDVGGGFGASSFGDLGNDQEWGELSDDESSSSDDEPDLKKPEGKTAEPKGGDKESAAKIA